MGKNFPRPVVVALRARSPELFRASMTASAAASLKDDERDPREVMTGLALWVHVARELGLDPEAELNRTADLLPPGPVADLLREFGARTDVTLEAFQWELIDTPDGPDFVPYTSRRSKHHRPAHQNPG